MILKEKIKISTKGWTHECSDKCCYTYGTDIYINDVKVSSGHYDNIDSIILDILNSLGYEIEIDYTF